MKKLLAVILLAMSLCVCLAACGDDDDDDRKSKKRDKDETEESATPTEEPTPAADTETIASTETWGDYTVGIPEGWTFRKGDAFDDADTRYCSVKKSDFKYFDFKMETEETMTKQYEYNKNTYTNEQTDISGTYGGIDWTGFQYSDGWGGYGFELYAITNGKPVRVSSCGFKFDSPEAEAVLGSLKIQ